MCASKETIEKAKVIMDLDRSGGEAGQHQLLSIHTHDLAAFPHITVVEKDLARQQCSYKTAVASSDAPLFVGQFSLRPKPAWMIINCKIVEQKRTASEAGLAEKGGQKKDKVEQAVEKVFGESMYDAKDLTVPKRVYNTATICEYHSITGTKKKGKKGRRGRHGHGRGKGSDSDSDEEDEKPTKVAFVKANAVADKKKKKKGRKGDDDDDDEEETAKVEAKTLPPQPAPDKDPNKKRFVPPFTDPGKRSDGGPPPPAKKEDSKQEHNATRSLNKNLIEQIESEILDQSPSVQWDEIVGLEYAKKTIDEVLVLPMKNPELRALVDFPKGLLLFGPPGTGKTMVAKAVATECKSTFFNISASILTSKWMGEGEKLVRTLFEVARERQPSIIFIDEIDSLLCSRTETDYESSRRLKTEFLTRMDGVASSAQAEDRVVIIGATNRPHDLDEAIRRRLAKRLYIPLPNKRGRTDFLNRALSISKIGHTITPKDVETVVDATKGFSGADLKSLVVEASMHPIRCAMESREANVDTIATNTIRKINMEDFQDALNMVKATVTKADIGRFMEWNDMYGSYPFTQEELDT